MNIWDTAGQEKFRSVSKAYFRNAVGALLVFSLNDHKSFEDLDEWLNDLQALASPNAAIILIGNKSDLPVQVSEADAQMFAKRHGLEYLQVSALTAENVPDAFMALANKIHERVNKGIIRGSFMVEARQPIVINTTKASEQKEGGCSC